MGAMSIDWQTLFQYGDDASPRLIELLQQLEASAAGLPAGGTTGEVLTKASNADGDADWEAGGGGTQPVGCVLGASNPVDVVAANPGYFVWDTIWDNCNETNEIEALPDGIGIDPTSIGTDTLTFTESGVWAFTADRIGSAPDATWVGQLLFGNMNISQLLDLPAVTSGQRPGANPSAIYNVSAGAQFSVGISTVTPATAESLDFTLAGLVVVRIG